MRLRPNTPRLAGADARQRLRGRGGSRGLTMIELLIGVALMGILAGLAVPSFNDWTARVRVSGQASALSSSLSYAKSESIRRGVRVTVCKSADPMAATPACSTAVDWNAGWLVFTDNTHLAGNDAGTLDGTDELLRIGEPLAGATATADDAVNHWIAFRPAQLAAGSGGLGGGAIGLCNGGHARTVSVASTGRVSEAGGSC